jgi:hypothetical protein
MSMNRINDNGLKKLKANNWMTLTKMTLAENRITNIGARCIAQCYWPQLEELNLSIFLSI